MPFTGPLMAKILVLDSTVSKMDINDWTLCLVDTVRPVQDQVTPSEYPVQNLPVETGQSNGKFI